MEVTKHDWEKYFRGAGEPNNGDLWKIDKEMRKVRMNQHGSQEYVEHADTNPIVKWMVDALEPPTF